MTATGHNSPETLARLQASAYRDMAPWSAAMFRDMLSLPGVVLLTEGTAAFVLARFIADEGEILALATDPARQRRGLAHALVERLHDQAATAGVARMFLEVAAPNAGARAFYARMGYAEDGLRKGYYRLPDGTRSDAVLMSRAV